MCIFALARTTADLKEKGQSVIAGQDVFKLYDTYGFPVELTEELAEEAGMTVDREETFLAGWKRPDLRGEKMDAARGQLSDQLLLVKIEKALGLKK